MDKDDTGDNNQADKPSLDNVNDSSSSNDANGGDREAMEMTVTASPAIQSAAPVVAVEELTATAMSAFISQPAQTADTTHMNEHDDVYEFKSSPEDNVASMLLNPETVRVATAITPVNYATYGLDEEVDLMEEDESNMHADEHIDAEEFVEEKRPNQNQQQQRYQTLPTFEIERCENGELDEYQKKSMDERRKVPPLRILLNKTVVADDSSKALAPSISVSSLSTKDAQVAGTSSRKRPSRKAPVNTLVGSERRINSASTRITRGQLAKQAVNTVETPTNLTNKRQRATRRTANIVEKTNATCALTPKRDREVSQAPSTSSAIQNDQAGTSMPPSPDANSRSSNGAANENNPEFNLQPERLSAAVTNLFGQSDVGAFMGLKKMLHQRWTRDFQNQQQQEWVPATYKSALTKSKKNDILNLFIPPLPKLDASPEELISNQQLRQRYLRKKQSSERHRLAGFVENEFKRQLNDIPMRSRTAITCMRVLGDSDIYNANVMDMNSDELQKAQSRSRDDVIIQVRQQMETLVTNTAKRHEMEADALYFEQCAEWERLVADQMPVDKRAKVEDFSLRDCSKRIKTKRVNLDRIIK